MVAVFIHGVADTHRLWDGVRSRLHSANSVALALPGFGVPMPPRFRADKESYVAWIIREIERFREPVDLVGHDWGCMFALRVGSLRPDLIRSVAAGSGPISSEYEWHRLAKVWQALGEGEAFMRNLTVDSLSAMLTSLSVPAGEARSTAERVSPQMKECILSLYRSAINVGNEWEGALKNIVRPTAIYWGRKDTECPLRFAYQMAGRLLDARVIELNCGHWVPLEKPAELAGLLEEHWRIAVPSRGI